MLLSRSKKELSPSSIVLQTISLFVRFVNFVFLKKIFISEFLSIPRIFIFGVASFLHYFFLP
eukprot:UN07879